MTKKTRVGQQGETEKGKGRGKGKKEWRGRQVQKDCFQPGDTGNVQHATCLTFIMYVDSGFQQGHMLHETRQDCYFMYHPTGQLLC